MPMTPRARGLVYAGLALAAFGQARANEPKGEPAAGAAVDAAPWLRPHVKTLSRPVDVYHYGYVPYMGALPPGGITAVDRGYAAAYLERRLGRFWDLTVPVRPYATVGGLYASIDPVIARTFGGIGDAWALFRLTLPRGLRFVDARGWSDNAGRGQRFSDAARAALAAAGCDAEYPATLVTGLESAGCRRVAVAALRALDVDAVLYRYQGIAYDACRQPPSGAFIVLRKQAIVAAPDGVALMTGSGESALLAAGERERVRALFLRAQPKGATQPAPWPELGSVAPAGLDGWMRAHLFGCGDYAEDALPGAATAPAPGPGPGPGKGPR